MSLGDRDDIAGKLGAGDHRVGFRELERQAAGPC